MNISRIGNCFYGKNNSNIYNIYAYKNTTTWNTLLNTSESLVGRSITWAEDAKNNCYYNTVYNIYIKPIVPIEELLIDFNYTLHDNGMATLTNWKKTLNGVSSYDMVIPNDPRIIL